MHQNGTWRPPVKLSYSRNPQPPRHSEIGLGYRHAHQHRKTRRQARDIASALRAEKEREIGVVSPVLPRIAVFVSGGGSNFKAIHAAILDGRIRAEVAVSPFLCILKFFWFSICVLCFSSPHHITISFNLLHGITACQSRRADYASAGRH